MKALEKKFDIVYMVLFFAVPFIPNFNRIDIIGPQFLYLACLATFYLIFSLSFKREIFFVPKKILIPIIIFLLVSLISFFKSFSIEESVFDFLKQFLIFLNLLIVLTIIYRNELQKLILGFLLFFLTLEVLYILFIFLQNYDFNYPPVRLRQFEGFAYNQNIAAFSIAIKTPVILFLFSKSNKRFFKTLLSLLLFISYFILFVISSRASFVAIILSSLLLLVFSLKKDRIKGLFKVGLLNIVLLLLAAFLQNILYVNSEKKLNISNRITELENASSNYRIGLYKDGIQMLMDNPILGVGIGNYKLISLDYGKDFIRQYEIPLHTHNDFIQFGAEIGFIGLVAYLTIFILPLALVFRNFLKTKESFNPILFFLSISILIYMIDASFNFPRIRPYSQTNFILIYGLLIYNLRINSFTIKKLYHITPILLISISSIFLFNRLNNSYAEQIFVYYDYNCCQSNLRQSTDDVADNIQSWPSLSTVTIPIKFQKALYYKRDENYDKAISLIHEAKNENPFLGFGDKLLSEIYTKLDIKDSAIFYSRRSIEKLPKNISHITNHQIILQKYELIDESNQVFRDFKYLMDENIWQNYLIILSSLKLKYAIPFTLEEKEHLAEALENFPENNFIRIAEKLILYGGSGVSFANEFDIQANELFKKKEYEEAIKLWEKAIGVIPSDDSYYLNIAHSYLLIEDLLKAKEYLDEIKAKNLYRGTGKFEFLYAILEIKNNNFSEACDYIKKAVDLEFQDAEKLKPSAKCYF